LGGGKRKKRKTTAQREGGTQGNVVIKKGEWRDEKSKRRAPFKGKRKRGGGFEISVTRIGKMNVSW